MPEMALNYTNKKEKEQKNMSKFPMNLQLFADPAPAAGDPTPAVPASQKTSAATTTTTAQIDYNKIAQLIEGKQAATEDSILKGYLKQQGLSQDEMTQAINTFKQQKAASQPDVAALQQQVAQAQDAVQQATINSAATMAAVTLGIDAKTIPYILKMADLSQAMGQDGKVSEDALNNALKKVLEDIPALKPQPGQATGFIQVGASGGGSQQQTTDDALKKAFGL